MRERNPRWHFVQHQRVRLEVRKSKQTIPGDFQVRFAPPVSPGPSRSPSPSTLRPTSNARMARAMAENTKGTTLPADTKRNTPAAIVDSAAMANNRISRLASFIGGLLPRLDQPWSDSPSSQQENSSTTNAGHRVQGRTAMCRERDPLGPRCRGRCCPLRRKRPSVRRVGDRALPTDRCAQEVG